jgi:hypothetical protein
MTLVRQKSTGKVVDIDDAKAQKLLQAKPDQYEEAGILDTAGYYGGRAVDTLGEMAGAAGDYLTSDEFLEYDLPRMGAGTVGFLGGAAKGAPLGPWGALTGGILGAAGGTSAYDVSRRAIGGQEDVPEYVPKPPESFADVPRAAGEYIMDEATGEAMGSTLGIPFRAVGALGRTPYGRAVAEKVVEPVVQGAKDLFTGVPASIGEFLSGVSQEHLHRIYERPRQVGEMVPPGGFGRERALARERAPFEAAESVQDAYQQVVKTSREDYADDLLRLGFNWNKRVDKPTINTILKKARTFFGDFLEFADDGVNVRPFEGGAANAEVDQLGVLYNELKDLIGEDGSISYKSLNDLKRKIDGLVSWQDSPFQKDSPATRALKEWRNYMRQVMEHKVKGLGEINAKYADAQRILEEGHGVFNTSEKTYNALEGLVSRAKGGSKSFLKTEEALKALNEKVPGIYDKALDTAAAMATSKGHQMTGRTPFAHTARGLASMGVPGAMLLSQADPMYSQAAFAGAVLTDPRLMRQTTGMAGRGFRGLETLGRTAIPPAAGRFGTTVGGPALEEELGLLGQEYGGY